jgi:hypothetical protein
VNLHHLHFQKDKQNTEQVKKAYKLNFREQNMPPSRNGKDGSNI